MASQSSDFFLWGYLKTPVLDAPAFHIIQDLNFWILANGHTAENSLPIGLPNWYRQIVIIWRILLKKKIGSSDVFYMVVHTKFVRMIESCNKLKCLLLIKFLK